MVARIGCELAPNSRPAFIIDQRRLLAGVKLTLVRYLAGVNRVREQCVEMTAREEFAAALSAIRRCAAFPEPEVRIHFPPAESLVRTAVQRAPDRPRQAAGGSGGE